jgi:hypothetical protein
MWCKKAGSQQSICCYACMETEGIHFEHLRWLSGSSNWNTVFQKACVHMVCVCVCGGGGGWYFDVGLAKPRKAKVLRA